MAEASTKTKQIRKLKRELNKAYRILNMAFLQRDQARMIASALEQELKKHEQKKPLVTITKIEEPDATDNQTDRQDTDDPRLEMRPV